MSGHETLCTNAGRGPYHEVCLFMMCTDKNGVVGKLRYSM